MNKRLTTLLLCLLTSCASQPSHNKSLKVAATPIPHAQILQVAKDDLKAQGYDLEIIVVDDYQTPNRALTNHEVDANFFQHLPFLEEQVAQFGYPIKSIARIELEPMGIYSRKIRSLAELKPHSTIAVPNDPTNEGRALQLLQKNGVITLNRTNELQATVRNIAKNPKQLHLIEIDAAMMPRVLDDVDAAVINTNYALVAQLSPLNDALALEGRDSPYVNVLVVRKGDETRPDIQALKKALTSPKVRTYILQEYQNAVIPAFD